MVAKTSVARSDVTISAEDAMLPGMLALPERAQGIVLFAHGSGSSRFSSRNRHVADLLNDARFGTLLFDLLTPEEDEADRRTRQCRFDTGLLAPRLTAAVGRTWSAIEGGLMPSKHQSRRR